MSLSSMNPRSGYSRDRSSASSSRANLGLLLVKNVSLFKGYLVLKLIQQHENNFDQDFALRVLEDKILLKMIELILDSNETEDLVSVDDEQDNFEKIFNFLYSEYSRIGKMYVVEDELSQAITSASQNLRRQELVELIKHLSESIRLEVKENSEEENEVQQESITSQNTSLYLKINSYFAKFKRYFSLGRAGEYDLEIENYKMVFDDQKKRRLEVQLVDLIDKMLILARKIEKTEWLEIHYCPISMLNKIKELTSLVKLYKSNTELISDMKFGEKLKRKVIDSKSSVLAETLRVKCHSSSSSIQIKPKRKRVKNKVDDDNDESDDDDDMSIESSLNSSSSSVLSVVTSSTETSSQVSNEFASKRTAKMKNMKNTMDILFKPRNVSVAKLPGIGIEYAKRLKAHKLNDLGDLVMFYQGECDSCARVFEDKIKGPPFFIRKSSIKKMLEIIVNYLHEK